MEFIKKPHTAIFSGNTGCGKTEMVLRLLEGVYNSYFDYIVIICPTFWKNKTYLSRSSLLLNNDVFIFGEGELDDLDVLLRLFSENLSGFNVLFILDDMISDRVMNKRRGELLRLSVSGRHDCFSLWILTQVYNAVPKDLRRQAKMLYIWKPKEYGEFKMICNENDVFEDGVGGDRAGLLRCIKKRLGQDRTCLVLRLENPCGYFLLD